MIEDNIVIVIDLSNYNSSCSEKVPFRAKVREKYENEVLVKSLVTGREYEIYYPQILETHDEKILSKLVNLQEYGNEES